MNHSDGPINGSDEEDFSGSDPVLSLLDRRKNRLIRVILGSRERLYPDEGSGVDPSAFRKVVLDEVNDFFEQVSDIVLTLQHDRSVVVNQLYLDKLDELKTDLSEQLNGQISELIKAD